MLLHENCFIYYLSWMTGDCCTWWNFPMSGGGLHVARMGVLDQHSALVGIRRGYCGRGSVGIKDRNLEFGIWLVWDSSIEAVDAYSFGGKQFRLTVLFPRYILIEEGGGINTISAELLFYKTFFSLFLSLKRGWRLVHYCIYFLFICENCRKYSLNCSITYVYT